MAQPSRQGIALFSVRMRFGEAQSPNFASSVDAHLLLSKAPLQQNHARSQILDFGHRAVQIDFLVKNP